MKQLLKLFFVVFIFVGCANDNTSVNNIVKYKGTYTGNNIMYNGSAIEASATIIVEESGKVILEIKLPSQIVSFYADADLIKELSSTEFEVNNSGQHLSLDFSSVVYFIYEQDANKYSGSLTKQ